MGFAGGAFSGAFFVVESMRDDLVRASDGKRIERY